MASVRAAPVGEGLHPCRVYVHDLFPRGWPPAPGVRDWPRNKYAQEYWLRQAMVGHPWRVASAQSADLVLVLTNFSLYCTAHRAYTMKFVWHSIFNDSTLCAGATTGYDLLRTRGDPSCRVRTPPQVLVYTNTECTAPWVGWSSGTGPPSRPRPEMLFVSDRVAPHKQSALRRSVVSPAVVAAPAFLVAERPTTPTGAAPVPWERRRLAFFAGHVPHSTCRGQGRRSERPRAPSPPRQHGPAGSSLLSAPHRSQRASRPPPHGR